MFAGVRAIALDVDGVLTDGTFIWGTAGEEFKRFSFVDSTGVRQAIAAAIQVALVSAETSESGMALVQRYADKIGIEDVFKGSRDKAAAITTFAAKHGFRLDEVCFVGDD